MQEELLDSEGDFRAPRMADAMRGTILVATFRWLRERGLEAAYREQLGASVRDEILATSASDWTRLDLVLAHYDALEALMLGHDTYILLGAEVSRAVNGVFLTTVARLAGNLGASPLTPLSRAAKVFARNVRGGAALVVRVAPTEARLDLRGAPIARSRVHRDTIEGSLLDGCRPFAAHVKVSEIPSSRDATSYSFRIRW